MDRKVWLRCVQSIFFPKGEDGLTNSIYDHGYISIGATTKATIKEDGSYDVCDSFGDIYNISALLGQEHFIEICERG